MTVYLVGGSQRTGSSMMMAALHAGGMQVAYDPERNKATAPFDDTSYQVNKGGLWELSAEDYKAVDFPAAYDGQAVKVLNEKILKINSSLRYKIIFLLREPEEMRQSWHAAFGRETQHPLWRKHKTATAVHVVQTHLAHVLRKELKLDVINLWYRDILAMPDRAFKHLKREGWPLDPMAAAAVVQPELCRFRYEELSIGA